LLDVQVANGVEVTLVVPANLWSSQVLELRGDMPNDFVAKVSLSPFTARCHGPIHNMLYLARWWGAPYELPIPTAFHTVALPH
jgi:hypothetical protein